MIERIEWEGRTSELRSPFMRGIGERPLRLTLHPQSLVDLTEDEKAAMALLHELSNLQELQFFSTSPGEFPHIELGEPSAQEDHIPVALKRGDSEEIMWTLVWNRHQWPNIAARLVNPGRQNYEDLLHDLLLAQAHKSVGGDILITKSPLLLSNRSNQPISVTNPRTPLEATRLVGLFLRSRNNYTHSASPKVKRTTNRGMFYWVLARYHLPNMWRYFSACVRAGKLRGDDTQALGEAILHRTVRALEALDAIGIRFYASHDRDDFLEIMYHFDYLTLLLAGAIDAQARIANRAYRLRTKEWSASFRHDRFLKAVRENGACELHQLAADLRFQSVLTLLYELRNTIHGAAPQVIAYQDNSNPRITHTLALVSPISEKLLKAAGDLDGIEEWGLATKFTEVLLEPYSYASALVAASLRTINDVAGTTDVTRLFPDGRTVPPLTDMPNAPV